MLTEGSGQAGTRRRGDFGGVWRRGRPVLVGVDVGVLPWVSWHHGQRHTRAVEAVPGLKGPKMHRQEGIAAARGLGQRRRLTQIRAANRRCQGSGAQGVCGGLGGDVRDSRG
jgi:hypothetical protein